MQKRATALANASLRFLRSVRSCLKGRKVTEAQEIQIDAAEKLEPKSQTRNCLPEKQKRPNL